MMASASSTVKPLRVMAIIAVLRAFTILLVYISLRCMAVSFPVRLIAHRQ